jgi:hypothetical protein
MPVIGETTDGTIMKPPFITFAITLGRYRWFLKAKLALWQ